MGTAGSADDELVFRYSPAAPGEPVVTICRAIAWIRGTAVADLDPLEQSVDTDALAELFRTTVGDGMFYRSSGGESNPTVTFEYEGLTVTVESERIVIDPSTG